MNLIEINQQTCSQDGICAAVCPAKLINMTPEAFPLPVDDIGDLCIRCGHCVAVCPSGSLRHAELPLEQCQSVKTELLLSSDQTEQFLRNRRSIRNYCNQDVSQDKLQQLIELARYAPSGHNSQTGEWLVLTNRDELNRLINHVGDWMRWMLVHMPEFATYLHMDKALERMEEGEDVVLRGAPALIIAHAPENDLMAPATCTLALSYLELAATGMELGGCWAGYFSAAATSFPPLKKELGLPDGHRCFGAMMIGYPKFRYHRLPERKSPPIVWRE